MNIPNTLPTLSAGAHRPDEGNACVMEYVSLLAGEEWSDSPSCTHPALSRAAQVVNDRLSDDDRHLLVPLIGRLFGTTLPVDIGVFALRIARTVENLSPVAKDFNDVTERYLDGEAGEDELVAARNAAYAANIDSAAAYATSAAYAAYDAAAYAARATTAAYAAYAAAYAASTTTAAYAAYAAYAAANGAAAYVAWLASVIDVYDELSGRKDHREVSDEELSALVLAVQR